MPTKKIAQKIFVLDTNVILNNANSIFHYPNAEIIIPLCVINKLDDFKKLLNSVGRHARLFLEKIEEFQKQVDLSKGISLENKTSLRIYAPNKTYQKLPSYFDTSKTSTQVLTACLLLKEENQKPILVSNDVNLRIRAKIFGIESIAFDNKNIEIESLYEAIEKIELSDAQWKELEISDAVNICPQKAFENKYYLAQSSSQENGLFLMEITKKEAKKRGLPNLRQSVEAFEIYTRKDIVDLFEKYNVLSKKEILSRQNIRAEKYSTITQIEARALLDIIDSIVLPNSYQQQEQLAKSITAVKSVGGSLKNQKKELSKLTATIEKLIEEKNKLGTFLIQEKKVTGELKAARFHRDKIIPTMEAIRTQADALESMVDDKIWQLPKYRDILFIS